MELSYETIKEIFFSFGFVVGGLLSVVLCGVVDVFNFFFVSVKYRLKKLEDKKNVND